MVLLWTKLNPIHPRMLCAKFGWNWPSGSGGEDFLISSMNFCYFLIISPWKRIGPFIWTKLNPLHPKLLCAKFGWNMGEWFWRRRFLNFVNVFSLFRNYLPSEKGGALHLKKLESPSPKDALFQVWLKLAQLFRRRRFFKISSFFPPPFLNYLPVEKVGPFIWTNVNSLQPRMVCAKFGYNGSVVLEKIF